MPKTIIIDPGHGGFDPGAVYGSRREKDDSLRLALAVGQNLENAGYKIVYTRKDDRYDSPYDKAQIANNAGGDLFLSFHRNFAERPDLYKGVQALVYDKNPLALRVAKDVNEALARIGFENIGIESRKELVVLRRTKMPAVLLEVGFINSSVDNQLFDENFNQIASSIASGVEQALPLTDMRPEARAQDRTSDMDYDMPGGNNSAHMNYDMPGGNDNMSDSNNNPMDYNLPGSNYNDMNYSMPNSNYSDMNYDLPGSNYNMNTNYDMPNNSNTNYDMADNNSNMNYDMADNNMRQTEESMRRALGNVQIEIIPNRPRPPMPKMWYYVQVGLFRYPENAVYLMGQLKQQGYNTTWKRVGGLIAVWVGPVPTLDEAVALQEKLQNDGYETLIVTGDAVNK